MASTSRAAFLRAVVALTQAADTPAVRASDDMGDLLRRGLTVTGFNVLETFIAGRLEEVATYVNGGAVQFLDLPDSLQTRAIRNTLDIATSRSKRMGKDLADLRPFARSVGTSLVAVDRTLALSPFTWMWQGSNMAVSDYAAVLKGFHIDKPWKAVNDIATRLGFPSPDLESALDDLSRERHKCAHEALYGVTAIWLRTVPDRAMALGVSFDVLVSIAATRLRTGEEAFLRDEKAMSAGDVGFRFVRERTSGAAEISEGAKRAFRVDADPDALYAAAAARCRTSDVLVRQAITGGLVNWTVPSVS